MLASALCASAQNGAKASFEWQAVDRVRSLFDEKTELCGESNFAHMGPYVINEYKSVRYQISAVVGKRASDALRVQAVGSLRQYWAKDRKWQPWANDQVLLDYNVTRAESGKLELQTAAGADTSADELSPVPCDQTPNDENSKTAEFDQPSTPAAGRPVPKR